ncbi:DUF4349 domain-containing protein [Pseudonocardia xinjiangensis]|uniref:DUF4349 domain-containing protein n=1 Tax=Pseudonocardia xinjiangensis TaxID=75289 RepID=A0ABX1RG08_9PSEU|nr:DUF4349 domain-containing protein [Pseudonocardia xinjiangensis]
MTRWHRRRSALVAVAVLGVLAVGTGVVLTGYSEPGPARSTAVAPAHPRPVLPGGEEKSALTDAAAGAVAPGFAADGGRAAALPPDRTPGPGLPVGTVQRSLVRTAQLSVEVADPAASSRQVRTAAAAADGLVTEEQSSDTGSWVVLRVPAESLERLIDDIAAIGRVVGRSTQVLDATEEVVDLDARVASQQASVARVRGLLAQAASIGDVVAIESELSRREADLDSLTSRLEALREQVALSMLTVDLRATGTPPAADPAPPGFRDGLASGLAGLRTLGSAALAVVGFVLPFLPVLAVLGGMAWLVRRLVRARRTPAVAGAGGRSGPGSEGESGT